MRQKKVMKGNITLSPQELNILRNAILKKYSSSKNVPVELLSEHFNSNQGNYLLLQNEITADQKNATVGSKPLAILLHYSKNNPKSFTFRKGIIEILTRYAFDFSIEDFIKYATLEGKVISLQAYSNILGYWDCYYDKDATFQEHLRRNGKAQISVLSIMIQLKSNGQPEVQFYHPRNGGSGTFEIQGSNLILQLRSEKNLEPTYMIMNCGRPIANFYEHIPFLAGYFLHINRFANPKTARCLMIYDKDKKDIDFKDPIFRSTFQHKRTLEIQNNSTGLERIKKFFASGINTMTMNVNDFTETDDKQINGTDSK